ncbi:protein male-specific lethal-3 [Lutzomyia longipalpis]|uniref:protein male-specific lethal-3 n=1 Tax=Lutzomyia longipalpis TaxID=7200 RepID=UPI00248364AF|nr:protein male-specific lethal-3 [Lutzomyia longipalpis]
MVSTRGIKYAFSEGEKVLCYEPDPTKAKVLYDSKVLEIFDTRDRRGRRIVEYLIHFQGWNSSWDRRVSETFVLKDNVVNRQLQKDLAEKSQLCLGAYLYRKDRKKSKSSGSAEVAETTPPVTFPTIAKEEHELQMQDNDAESYSSSTESGSGPIEDEKVIIQVSKKLREFMEFDNRMVTKEYRLAVLPAQIPIVTILEKFVKQCSVKLICNYIRQDHRKRRNSTTRSDKEPLDTEKLTNKLNLYKEVADGLRIYFDFTLKDHLLYSQEQQQAEMVLDEEYLKTFTYIPSEKSFTDLIFPSTSEKSTPTSATEVTDDTARRRLRSYKLEADYVGTDGAMPFAAKITEILRSVQPLNSSVPLRMKMLLQNTLAWHLLPSNAPAEPSMIYGAPHLARLLIKLPEFLTHSIGTMSEEKMKHLLDYLGELLEFLEDHTNWFGEEHYHTSLIKMEMED